MLSSRLDELQRKRAWRIGAAELDALRTAVKRFQGTHNFHNFTVDKEFRDRSNQRHMKSIQVADPVVHGKTEWISVLLHGQSFMLHQVFNLQIVLWAFLIAQPLHTSRSCVQPHLVSTTRDVMLT